MTFVCEWCAEGLSAEEIDEDATYPDDQIGGTDGETGGFICEGCADAATEDAVAERE